MKKSLLLAATLMVASASVHAQEVTPPAKAQIEVYNGSSYSYATYDDEEWQAQVAIAGNQMYIKNIFPNMQNTKWIVGTISNGKVVFAGGQAIGEQDQSLMGGSDKYTDCTFYGVNENFEDTDATFSWNESTKTLKSLDYELASYTQLGGGYNDMFDGTSDPSATLTLVGTGEIVDPEPTAPKIYLRGEFNEWGTTHEFVAGSEEGVYTVSLDELSGVFKIATEDWSTVDLGGNAGDALTVGTPYSLVEKGANLVLTTTVKNAVVTYNANEKTVTVTGDVPGLTYYMKHAWGTGLDADWSWKELTDNGNGSYSVVALYGGTGVNVNTVASDAGATWFPEPNVVDPSEAQSTIHLSEVNIGDECTFTYWKDNNFVEIVKSVATGVNDLNVKASQVYKVVENGQVVIVKDNARYNVAGQMIK